MNRKKILFPWIIFLLLPLISLSAFHFEPITMTFSPEGSQSIRTFRARNTQDSIIALQIKMVSREMDKNGKETLLPADKEFTVYPERIILEPGQNQAIRVQWKGKSAIEKELAYRIIVEQLPVRFDEENQEGGNISILYRYAGSVYIRPPAAEPDIEMSAYKINPDTDNFLLFFENRGTAHGILTDMQVSVESEAGQSLILEGEDLKGIEGENILAEHSRTFTLPVPEQFKDKEVDLSVTYRVMQ